MEKIYFDHAATSWPKPPQVLAAINSYFTDYGANINRGGYQAAYGAAEIVYETRERLAALFNFPDCKNTVFTANITAALNLLLKGLLRPGDHLLTSSMEHNAVMRPLQQLARQGVEFDCLPCDERGRLLLEHLPALCRPQTRAVTLTHASNVCGTLMPIAEVGRFCRERGLFFIVDSAQTAGIFPIDMQAMCIDALAFTGHKGLLGPQGTGGMILSDELAARLEPLISGGTGSISHTEDIPAFLPDRFEAGTLNLPGLFGLHAALRYLTETGLDTIRERELALTGLFLQAAAELPRLKLLGLSGIEGRAPVVALQTPEHDEAEIAQGLAERGVMTRVGMHCAPRAHRTLGSYPTGALRFSFGHTNTEAEIAAAVAHLERLTHGF
ncbi:MAG: aminotransferase class V-fold PLP-dependent enzyme [Bacillota bacterium]|nr:aminotransferase class V-fold PLP-dependent enzyme [Bacillota bacterium]